MPFKFSLESHETGAFYGGVITALTRIAYQQFYSSTGADQVEPPMTPTQQMPLALLAIDMVINSFPEAIRNRMAEQREEMAEAVVGGVVLKLVP